MNTAAGKQGHTIALLMTVANISLVLASVEALDYRAQVLYWKKSSYATGLLAYLFIELLLQTVDVYKGIVSLNYDILYPTGDLFTTTVQPVVVARKGGSIQKHGCTDFFTGHENELIHHLMENFSEPQDCILAINCEPCKQWSCSTKSMYLSNFFIFLKIGIKVFKYYWKICNYANW